MAGTGAASDHLQELAWRACPDRSAVECAVLEVPLDREDAGSPTVGLAVRRLPAADPQRRRGVLVTIAGGPGQRGTDLVYPGAHSPVIASRFDIVSFDPRGTSGQTSITCIPAWDPFGDLDRTPDDPVERAALDARIRELAAECRSTHGRLLAHIGTAETVLDLEALRHALGAERISLLGSSYGSAVALRYVDAFPQRVRSVVLDGYSDPNAAPPERELEQAAAFERELNELLVECALRPGCPIEGPDPGATLDRLLEELDEAPLAVDDVRVLRQADAYEAITGALVRGPAARAALLSAIGAADRDDGAGLLALAGAVRADFEASGLDLGTFMAIRCADDGAAWAHLSREEAAAFTDRVYELAPRLGPWLWSPPAAGDLPPVGLCAMSTSDIDATGTVGRRVDGAGAGPILVLAASGDPTTPLSAARRAVEELDQAVLFAIRADQHLVYPYAVAAPDSPAGRCVLGVVESYLVAGTLPTGRGCP